MANVEMKIVGAAELVKKLERLDRLKAVYPIIKAAATHIKGKVDVYPPSSEANMPGSYPARWYQRGYGPRWALRGGGAGGRKTSETLGRKWTIKIRDGGMTAEVGNNVSYSPYVHDREEQAKFHKARGWLTVQDVAEQEEATVTKFVNDGLQQAINRMGL